MDDATAAMLYRSDLRDILRALFVIIVIFGFYLRLESKRAWKNADLFRRTMRRYRSARRALRSKSRQVEVMANRLTKANMVITEQEIEARRVTAIRVKAERGVRTKDDELQEALAMIRKLKRAPSLDVEV